MILQMKMVYPFSHFMLFLEIIRTRLCYYIQLQNTRNSYNYIEGFAKHVNN